MPEMKRYNLKDFKEICHKCEMAYYGDYIALDCSYCLIPKICGLNNKYVAVLQTAHQYLEDKNKLQSFLKEYFEGE